MSKDAELVTRAEHERLLRRVESIYGRILATLASTVALRDEGTGGHCERVAHNATLLAKELAHAYERGQVGGESMATKAEIDFNFNNVFWAAILHDLGKIVIPEDLLNKPGRLTEQEWTIMRTHSDIGADLVAGVSPDFDRISEGIRSHHERWDGTGYPQGLKGTAIPFVGRCIGVADVFEAMTSDRPYHKKISEAEGLAHIRGLAGTHLWDQAVDCFVALYNQGDIYSSRTKFLPPLGSAPPFG